MAFRNHLRQRLDPAVWRLGGGEGSLVAIYMPAVELLHAVTQHQRGASSGLRLHLFIKRPVKERARAVIEVIGNHPTLDVVESKRLRVQLSHDLRSRTAQRFDQATRGQIVGAFLLSASKRAASTEGAPSPTATWVASFSKTTNAIQSLESDLEAWLPCLRDMLETAQR